jgi:hypothetical protein
MTVIYLSGPITGKRDNNRRAFIKAAERLEKYMGPENDSFRIISPIKIAEIVDLNFSDLSRILSKPQKPKWEDYMRACIKRLCEATHVYFLKGWEKSRGSCLERYIAEGLGISRLETIEELKELRGSIK